MADADKDIVITPNTGSSSNDPTIEFTGGDNNTITLSVLDNATLSIDGTVGQLFSITDSSGGTIFSVNDISGIPSIEVDDDGTVRLAEFAGNVLVGTATDDGSNKLQVDGNIDATNMSATTFTGALSGNASTATTADLLDGLNSTQFLRSDADDTASGSYSFTNSYNEFGNSTGSVSNDGSWNARVNIAGSSHARLDVKSVSDGIITTMYSHTGQSVGKVGTYSNHPLVLMTNGASSATLSTSGSLSTTAQGTLWGSSNDGSGSGLDADTVDGVHESTFMRKSANSSLDMNNYDITDVEDIYLQDRIAHDGDTDTYMQFHAANQWRVVTGGAERLEVNDSQVTIANGLTVTNGDITLSGTGRIQGVDTVSSGTDAANKNYVDTAVASAGPSYSATASGSIANGAPVVVNSSGTLSAVGIGSVANNEKSTGTTNLSGGATQFTGQYSITFDPTEECFLILCADGNTNKMMGQVVTLDAGGTPTFGAKQDTGLFVAGSYDDGTSTSCFDETIGSVVLAYYNYSNNDLKAVSIALDGAARTFSVGTPVTIDSAAYPRRMDIVYGSGFSGCALAYYRNLNILRMAIIKGSSGGTTLSAGSPLTVESQSNSRFGVAYHPTHNRIVAVYKAPYYPSVGIFSVSGYSVSKVTSSQLGSGNISYYNDFVGVHGVVYDPVADVFFVPYMRDFSNVHGRPFTITTSAITIGSEYTIDAGVSSANAILATFNDTPGNILVTYTDGSNNGLMSTVTLASNNTLTVTTSGTSWASGKAPKNMDTAYDSVNNYTFVNWRDDTASAVEPNYSIMRTTQNDTNLTSGNFIGISNGSYSNGQTATVQLSGSVDDAQSGLTPGSAYYVQGSGGIGPSASSPSVLAGTAVSSTKLVVK